MLVFLQRASALMSAQICGLWESTGAASRWCALAADEKEDMIHELDAVVAHLYGLSEPQLVHIFETFHEGWDYHERLEGVFRHFRGMEKS